MFKPYLHVIEKAFRPSLSERLSKSWAEAALNFEGSAGPHLSTAPDKKEYPSSGTSATVACLEVVRYSPATWRMPIHEPVVKPQSSLPRTRSIMQEVLRLTHVLQHGTRSEGTWKVDEAGVVAERSPQQGHSRITSGTTTVANGGFVSPAFVFPLSAGDINTEEVDSDTTMSPILISVTPEALQAPTSRVRKALAVQRYELESSLHEQLGFLELGHEIEMAELRDDHEIVVRDLQHRIDLANRVMARRQLKSREREATLQNDLRRACNDILDLEAALSQKSSRASRLEAALREQKSCNTSLLSMVQEAEQEKDAATSGMTQLANQVATLTREASTFSSAYQTLNEKLDNAIEEKREIVVHVEALLVNRTKQYIERDQHVEAEFPCVLRPDQLHDAEQALIMSQQMHKKECELTSFLSRQMDEMKKEHETFKLETQLTVEKCKQELTLVKEASSLSTQTSLLHLSTFQKIERQEIGNEMDADLVNSLQACIEQDEAMSDALQQKVAEVVDLRLLYRGSKLHSHQELSALKAELTDAKNKLAAMAVEKEGAEWSLGCVRDELKDAQERAATASDCSQKWEEYLTSLVSASSDEVQQAYLDEQKTMIQRLKDRIAFYRRHTNDQESTIYRLESEVNWRDPVVYNELLIAYRWRDERNTYLAKLTAMEERFADELLLEPLALPPGAGQRTPEDIDQINHIDQVIRDVFQVDARAGSGNAPNNDVVVQYNAVLTALREEERKRLDAERGSVHEDNDASWDHGAL